MCSSKKKQNHQIHFLFSLLGEKNYFLFAKLKTLRNALRNATIFSFKDGEVEIHNLTFLRCKKNDDVCSTAIHKKKYKHNSRKSSKNGSGGGHRGGGGHFKEVLVT